MRQPTPNILDDVFSAPKPPTMLAVEAIQTDGGTQIRAGIDEGTVSEYAAIFQESRQWGNFPPVVVFYDGAEYWLADGFHRVAAWKRSGNAQIGARIPADVRSGTRRDAILHAAGANASHGLRRTNEDKRRAVEVLLRDEEWGVWSDAEIARRCNVSPMTVGRVRKELIYNNVIDAPSQRTVQRDGVTYTQDTTKIGKKPICHEATLPALNVPSPGTYSTPLGALPKNPIEDWELEEIVEQVAQEYYGSVTATAGAEMTQQSQAHAGDYWAKLRRVLDAFDVTTQRIEAAVAATVERMVGDRRALRAGSPEAKALGKEIKAATWGDPAPTKSGTANGLTPELEREFIRRYFELDLLLQQNDPERRMKWVIETRNSVVSSPWRWNTRSDVQVWHASNGEYWNRECDARYTHARIMKMGLQAFAEMQAEDAQSTDNQLLSVDGDRPLPGWVDAQPDEALTPDDLSVLQPIPSAAIVDDLEDPGEEGDDRREQLRRWWVRLMALQNDLRGWGDLTGRYTATMELERGLRKMMAITQREIDILEGRQVEEWGEVA